MSKKLTIEIIELIEQIVIDYNLENYNTDFPLGKNLKNAKTPLERAALKIVFNNDIKKTFGLEKTTLPSFIISKTVEKLINKECAYSDVKNILKEELKLSSEKIEGISQRILDNKYLKEDLSGKKDEEKTSPNNFPSFKKGLSQDLM